MTIQEGDEMKRLNIVFSTKLTFDDYVEEHSIALRCIPPETETQHIMYHQLEITPLISTNHTVDAFGNNVVSGYIAKPHRFLDFEMRCKVKVDAEQPRTDFMPCYRCFSDFTKPDAALYEFHSLIKNNALPPFERAKHYSEQLKNVMKYEKNSTTIKTTAAEAFAQKKGVCQDFSHIVLALLRIDKIPCRYIAGLAGFDGETHSWIEVWTGNCWKGFDPTSASPVAEDYVTLSQGRDFGDCAIDRGVMKGAFTRQMQLVSSKITVE